jgi:hypothetical protein
MVPENTNSENALYPKNKEEHINFIQSKVAARNREIDMLVARIARLQHNNSRDMLRLDELRLLKDIRDGRVKLVHAESGQPIKVNIFNLENK